MSKKLIVILGVVVGLAIAGGGGTWFVLKHMHDPLKAGIAAMDKGDLRAAAIEFRAAAKEKPNDPEVHYRLGLLELQLGDPVAAEKELKSARDGGFNARPIGPSLAQTYLAQRRFQDLLNEFPVEDQPPEAASQLLVFRGLAQMGLNDLTGAQASLTEAERLSPSAIDPPLAASRVAIAQNNYALAEQKVDRALTINAKRPDALLLKAQLQNLRGNRAGALTSLDAAIDVAPKMAAARLERANILVSMNQDDKAKADVTEVLKEEPRSAGGIYLQAVLATRAKDYPTADQALQKIAPIIARFPRAYYFQAIVKYNIGQAEQAAEAAARYVARTPTDPEGIKLLARIQLAARAPDKAVETLRGAVDSGRADAEMLDLLGRAYALSGQPQLAVKNFERAVELAPDQAEILTRLASTRLGMGDAVGALDDFEKSLRMAPAQVDAGEAMVVAALSAAEVDRAVDAVDRLRKQAGNTEAVGNLTGLVKMAQLDVEGARLAFDDTVHAFPNSLGAKLNLSKALVMLGRANEAEQVLNDVLQQDPANEQALGTVVNILINDGRISRAVAMVEAARAAARMNAPLASGLADLYLRVGSNEKAAALLDQALKEQPGNPILLSARARVQIATGNARDARETYRAMLDKTPGDVDTRRRLADLLVAANEAEGARGILRDGLKVTPGNGSLMQGLVQIDLKTSGVTAALITADALRRDPANMPAASVFKGDLLAGARRYPEAAAAYQAEFDARPSMVLLARLASALNSGGKPDEARQKLRDWIAQHPGDIDAMQVLASMDINARKLDEATVTLNQILKIAPRDPVTLNNLAWIYQQSHDKRAIDLSMKAYLLRPGPETADTLGWVLARQGDGANALLLLRQSGLQLRDNPSVQYHLAYAMQQNGQRDEAITLLKALVAKPADFDEKADARKLLTDLSGQ